MKIVIVGAGRMGREIALRLADEDHDITVVDTEEENLESVSTSIDVMTLLGNGADYSVLSQAEVGLVGFADSRHQRRRGQSCSAASPARSWA